MAANYVELVTEAISRLEDKEPKVYGEQCRAMVQEFVHVRDNLKGLLERAHGESAAMFKELYRLACEAKRVLERCCCDQWLQAVVLTPNHGPTWSIFEIFRSELIWCFTMLRGNLVDSSTVRILRHRDREEMFKLDQRNLREQLEREAGTGTLEENSIAEFLLARLDVNYGQHLDVRNPGDTLPRGSQQLNCRFMLQCTSCLQPRGNVSTVVLNHQIEGNRNVIDPGEISTVTPDLGWFGIRVAEKAFKKDPRVRMAWSKEVCIMAKLNHPNVVRFIGYSEGDAGPAIIMECEEKSLQQYIEELQRDEEQRRMSQTPSMGRRPGLLIELVVAVDILMQIASGMAYLHCQGVAHLDLKLANVLVTSCREHEFLHVKINDFGHSLFLNGVSGKILNPFEANHGTTIYRAPELFYAGKTVCMKAADVCSFGFTCWAILHCNEPKLNIETTRPPFYHQALVAGTRLDFDSSIPTQLQYLIQRCWDTNPDTRPPFSDICLFLQSYKAYLLGSQMSLVSFQYTYRTDQPRSVIRRIAEKLVLAGRLLLRQQESSHSRQGELDELQQEGSV